MASYPAQELNPYLSPNNYPTCSTPREAFSVSGVADIASLRAPRDVWDIVIGVLSVASFSIWFFGVPCLLGSVYSWTCGLALGSLSYIAAWVTIFPIRTVWRLQIDPEGIRVVRIGGTPKRFCWQAIEEIRPATRREVVIAWFWPPLLTYETTQACTTIGYFRISSRTSYFYFPPRDPKLFLDAVQRYQPNLVSTISSGENGSVE